MAIQVKIPVPRLGDVDPMYKDLARGVVQEEGLIFQDAHVSEHHVTVTAFADTVERARTAAKAVEGRLPVALFRKENAVNNSTTIGHVIGPVHTGSGDQHLQISVTIEVLLQRLDAALTSAGVPPEKKEGFLRNLKQFLHDVGTDVAAKVVSDLLTKPF